MRILLIEDHPIVRSACNFLLGDLANVEIVTASNGREGERAFHRDQPDVVVLDLNLPDGSGMDVLERLAASGSGGRVIVFSMNENTAAILRAMGAGAGGYITKSDPPEQLVEAVHAVAAGERYLGAIAARRVALSNISGDPGGRLSPREREVLSHLAEGLSIARIAERTGVSYRTAAALVAKLRGKLDLGSNAALIRYAVKAAESEMET